MNKDKKVRDYHVGDSDYSTRTIQPWDIWVEYGLNPWDADIVKRILRTKKIPNKSYALARIEDYEKIIHIAQERIDQIRQGNQYYSNIKMPEGRKPKT